MPFTTCLFRLVRLKLFRDKVRIARKRHAEVSYVVLRLEFLFLSRLTPWKLDKVEKRKFPAGGNKWGARKLEPPPTLFIKYFLIRRGDIASKKIRPNLNPSKIRKNLSQNRKSHQRNTARQTTPNRYFTKCHYLLRGAAFFRILHLMNY